jgi:hypothetical protein
MGHGRDPGIGKRIEKGIAGGSRSGEKLPGIEEVCHSVSSLHVTLTMDRCCDLESIVCP